MKKISMLAKCLVCTVLIFQSDQAKAVVVDLDFGGANFSDDFTNVGNSTAGQIRWNNIARDPAFTGAAGRIDLVVTVASGSTYDPGGGPSNLQGNGNNGVAEGATRLKLAVGTDVTFDFNFFYGNGNVASVTTSFAFLDFDQTTRTNNNGSVTVDESITFLGLNSSDLASYTYVTAGLLGIDPNSPLGPLFESTVEGGQPDNPTDLSALTMEQEQKIVQFDLVEATGFSLNLAVGGTPPAGDPDAARTFFISDAINFSQTTTTVTIPEPTTSLLVILGGSIFSLRRRRHR